MDSQKIKDFNKRWDITDDLTYEEKFKKFKVRVLNIFRDIDNLVTEKGISKFCQILGVPEHWEQSTYGYGKWSQNITGAFKKENNEKKFYFLLQIVFNLPIPNDYRHHQTVNVSRELLNQLIEALDFSNVNLAITVKNNEIIFYPRGEKKLDQKLVDEVLSFLDTKSQEHFIQALNFYQRNNAKDAVKSADSLRRSIEEFLRLRLQNQKGLAANIKELQTHLKQDNRDPKIRSIIFQTISYLDEYFNENSKHQDGDINEAENEFLIYQSGVLMRYVNRAFKI